MTSCKGSLLGHAIRGVFQTSSFESVFSDFPTKSFNFEEGFCLNNTYENHKYL